MADAGFTYVPLVIPEDSTSDPSDVDGPRRLDTPMEEHELANTEMARTTRGYGILTPEVMDGDDAGSTGPNAQIVADLTPSERADYFDALYGHPSGNLAVSPESCAGLALAEFPDPLSDEAVSAASNEAHDLLLAAIEADPRTVEAGRAWSACMHHAGFEFEIRPDAQGYVWDLYAEHIGPLEAAASEQGVDPRTLLDPEIASALIAEEVAIATADFTCWLPLLQVREDVSADMEPGIVARYPVLADALGY